MTRNHTQKHQKKQGSGPPAAADVKGFTHIYHPISKFTGMDSREIFLREWIPVKKISCEIREKGFVLISMCG